MSSVNECYKSVLPVSGWDQTLDEYSWINLRRVAKD